MNRRFHDRIIKIDGREERFIAHWLGDTGIIIEVSGPEQYLLHEHEITEYNGSQLILEVDMLEFAQFTANEPVRHLHQLLNDGWKFAPGVYGSNLHEQPMPLTLWRQKPGSKEESMREES